MKEYELFVKENGDIEMYCGGQFTLGASGLGLANNFATLWNALDFAGERLMELRTTGAQDARVSTFTVRTLPKGSVVRREPIPELKPDSVPEDCYEGRCEHLKNFAGSCMFYMTEYPPQRNC